MAELLQLVSDWIVAFLQQVGLWGIFLALLIESACIPITSEVFLLFGGFLVAKGEFGLLAASLAGTAGFVVGSLLPYYVGRKHGKAILGRGGRFFFASENELDRVEAWFVRHGSRAVLIGRFIPLVRDFISLPAGHAGMPIGKFMLYTAMGTFPWIFGITYAGSLLESEWSKILDMVARGNRIILSLIVFLLIVLLVRRFRHQRSA